MKTYSLDLRERVVAAVDGKEGTRAEIGRRFRVSRAWVGKPLAQRRRTGSIAPRPLDRGPGAAADGPRPQNAADGPRPQKGPSGPPGGAAPTSRTPGGRGGRGRAG